MNKYIIINTTTDSLKEAEKIEEVLLNEKLAACIQVSKITSYYNWQEKQEKTEEYLLVIKTRKRLFNQIEDKIKEIHSYEVPEIIAYEITNISHDYAKWIDEITRKDDLEWI